MATRKQAEEALYDAIISNAEEATEATKASASDALKALAEAYANVAFGAQGGEKIARTETDYRYTAASRNLNESRNTSDYHETRHHGEERNRPTGFGDDGEDG